MEEEDYSDMGRLVAPALHGVRGERQTGQGQSVRTLAGSSRVQSAVTARLYKPARLRHLRPPRLLSLLTHLAPILTSTYFLRLAAGDSPRPRHRTPRSRHHRPAFIYLSYPPAHSIALPLSPHTTLHSTTITTTTTKLHHGSLRQHQQHQLLRLRV